MGRTLRRFKWKPRELVRSLGIAVAAGIGVGLIYVWNFQLSWGLLSAAIAAGVTFVLVMFGLAHWFRRLGEPLLYLNIGLSGAIAGAAWWWVAEPPQLKLGVSIVTGALMACFVAWCEGRGPDPGRHAA